MQKRLRRHLPTVRRELAQPLRRPLGHRWWRHPFATLRRQHIAVETVRTALPWALWWASIGSVLCICQQRWIHRSSS
jgi:hypothetical protein